MEYKDPEIPMVLKIFLVIMSLVILLSMILIPLAAGIAVYKIFS